MKLKLGKLLEAFGVGDADGDGLEIEFGPGVVGLTAIAVVVALVVIAFCTYILSAHPDVLLKVVVIVGGVLSVFLMGTWIFAHYHPDLALLGGSKLLQYRKMQMAAANPSIMLDATPTSAPLPSAPSTTLLKGETDA